MRSALRRGDTGGFTVSFTTHFLITTTQRANQREVGIDKQALALEQSGTLAQ
jgi:hypothetical protein